MVRPPAAGVGDTKLGLALKGFLASYEDTARIDSQENTALSLVLTACRLKENGVGCRSRELRYDVEICVWVTKSAVKSARVGKK